VPSFCILGDNMNYELRKKDTKVFMKQQSVELLLLLVVIFLTMVGYFMLGIVFWVGVRYVMFFGGKK